MKTNKLGLNKPTATNLKPFRKKAVSSANQHVSTKMTRERLEMPDGSGALVLYAKSEGKLRAIEVTPLKNVSSERGRNEIWIIVANTVAPQRLSLEMGPSKTVWADLERFRVYRDQYLLRK